ncbi:HamA C-terminal domain-containing protein [Spirochaeta dissipatitropha]
MRSNGLNFEIVLNDSLMGLDLKSEINPNSNKSILSILNDYEDGEWRSEKFDKFIWDNIAQTALSADERNNLVNSAYSELVESAKKLRLSDAEKDEIGKGSELAEIFLYGVMKNFYKALPVVPKIFYKQNNQDNAKGADSVHIVIEDNNFSIWFGEAKFYNSIEDARLTTIIESVGNSLKTDKLRKENSIIINVNDIEKLQIDYLLREQIKKALQNTESIDHLKQKLHIPILILHECKFTKDCKEYSDEYKNGIIDYHKERAISYFKKQVSKLKNDVYKYDEVQFHLVLFPVPEKLPIINRFLSKARVFREG